MRLVVAGFAGMVGMVASASAFSAPALRLTRPTVRNSAVDARGPTMAATKCVINSKDYDPILRTRMAGRATSKQTRGGRHEHEVSRGDAAAALASEDEPTYLPGFVGAANSRR